jgi:multiple sugar transport system substrate-binding protein
MIGKSKKLRNFLHSVVLIVILILSTKLLSGCTNNSEATLSFVVSQGEVEYFKPLIEQFNQRNPNLNIKLADESSKANDSDQLKEFYKSDFRKESPKYDLIYLDIVWVPEFAENQGLLDITKEFPPTDLKKEFLQSEVDDGMYNNKMYRIPFRTDLGVLYYRKDLLEQVNEKPPETFDDLLRISQKVKQQRSDIEYGYLWQGRKTEALAAMFVEVLEGYGGFWINRQNNQVGLDKPEAIAAVEFLASTIDKGVSPQSVTTEDENDTRKKFRLGKAVFMRNWPNVWLNANQSGSNVRGKIAIQPMVSALGENSGASKGGWGFGVAKNTKHKKEAVEAIKFLTSAAAQRQFTLGYGSVPTRRQLFFEPKIVAKYNHYPKLLSFMANNIEDKSVKLVSRPLIPQYTAASRILQKHLHAALTTKRNSIREEMKKAAQETTELLNTN